MRTPVRTSLCVVLAVVVPWVLLVGELVVLISWLDGDLAYLAGERTNGPIFTTTPGNA